MADFTGELEDTIEGLYPNGLVVAAQTAVPVWTAPVPLPIPPDDEEFGTEEAGAPVVFGDEETGVKAAGPDDDFFERIIVVPRFIDAGFVLSEQVHALDLFNSWRHEARDLETFVNDAGDGVTVDDLPTLTFSLPRLSSLLLTVRISTEGPPTIDGPLIFGFDTQDVEVPITGQRAILLAVEPVRPCLETLHFLTDVQRRRDGGEVRASLRRAPRQSFELTYELEGLDRRFLDARLFSGLARAFGLPLWHEAALAASPIGIGDTIITVDHTELSDFRVGGLAIAFVSPANYEALQIEDVPSATSIEFTSEFTKTFRRGTRIIPVRTVRLGNQAKGERYPLEMNRVKFQATVLDESLDLADPGSYPLLGGRLILDDALIIDQTLSEALEQRSVVIDSLTGGWDAFTFEPHSRRGSEIRLVSIARPRLQSLRALAHYLRGRWRSFYVPTFWEEFLPTQTISSAGTVMTFENFGFHKFVAGASPRGAVRVTLTDGTKISRLIASTAEIDDDEETLTVTAAWGSTATPAQIRRVEFLELVRLDSDDVRIEHASALGEATLFVPCRAIDE